MKLEKLYDIQCGYCDFHDENLSAKEVSPEVCPKCKSDSVKIIREYPPRGN